MISLGFGNKNKPLLGIDISSSGIKIVELVKQGEKFVLKGFDVIALPDGAVVDRSVVDVMAVGEALRTVVSRCGTKVKDGAAAVAGAAVITKVITVPTEFKDDQLEGQIEIEADQHIPYPLEDVALDFSIIGPTEQNDATNDVLLVACRKETVDSVVDAFDLASLNAKVLDFEPYAQQRALTCLLNVREIDPKAVVVLVDIGAMTLDVSVFHEGEMIYSREQVFGGSQLLTEMSVSYGLSEAEARRQLGRPELLPEGAQTAIIDPFKGQILQQVMRSLQLFFAATNYNDVDTIVLSGGVAALGGLQETLQSDLGTQVIVANPLEFVDGSAISDQAELARNASSLMLAIGLAMWGGIPMHRPAPKINFRPWRAERRQEVMRKLLGAIAFVVIFAVILAMLGRFGVSQLVGAQGDRNKFISAEIKRLNADLKEIKELRRQRARMIERMRIIQNLQGNRPIIVHIFDELVQVLPEDTYFTKMDVKGKRVSINGVAGTNSKVSALMRNIDASGWFESPNLTAIKANPKYGALASSFVLSFTLEEQQRDDDE